MESLRPHAEYIQKISHHARYFGKQVATQLVDETEMKTMGRRLPMTSGEVYGTKLIRCSVQGTGLCLLEALTFLFLFYFNSADKADKEMVKLQLVAKYGFMPDASAFYEAGTVKGNLLDVLTVNSAKLLDSCKTLHNDDKLDCVKWFSQYETGGDDCKDPSDSMAIFIFRLLFKDDVILCLHQWFKSPNETSATYSNPAIFWDNFGRDPLRLTYLSEIEEDFDVKTHKQVHLRSIDGHFEPVVPLSPEDDENYDSTMCVQVRDEHFATLRGKLFTASSSSRLPASSSSHSSLPASSSSRPPASSSSHSSLPASSSSHSSLPASSSYRPDGCEVQDLTVDSSDCDSDPEMTE